MAYQKNNRSLKLAAQSKKRMKEVLRKRENPDREKEEMFRIKSKKISPSMMWSNYIE